MVPDQILWYHHRCQISFWFQMKSVSLFCWLIQIKDMGKKFQTFLSFHFICLIFYKQRGGKLESWSRTKSVMKKLDTSKVACVLEPEMDEPTNILPCLCFTNARLGPSEIWLILLFSATIKVDFWKNEEQIIKKKRQITGLLKCFFFSTYADLIELPWILDSSIRLLFNYHEFCIQNNQYYIFWPIFCPAPSIRAWKFIKKKWS